MSCSGTTTMRVVFVALCVVLALQCVMSMKVQTASQTRFRELVKNECPSGRTCCMDGDTLEMCRFVDGVCCGNHGFCCPPGATCGEKKGEGAMDCLIPKVETPSPTPQPTDATPLVSAQEKTHMNRTEDRIRVTPKRRKEGLILANDNKIIHEYKQLAPEDAPSDTY